MSERAKKLHYHIVGGTIMAIHDVVYDPDVTNLGAELVESVVQTISTDLQVTISGVTMFLAAWEDPDHWASDWAEKLGVDVDDAPGAVMELLLQAITDD